MKNLWRLKFGFLFLLLGFCYNPTFAQLPQCTLIYLDQYSVTGLLSTGNIYNYNPALPSSPTNPSLNTIHTLGQNTFGLTVSEILGTGNPTLTFYTVTDDQYWYYNPATSSWVNTNHSTGSQGTAYNIASGGGYIYNLSGMDGNVYVYDGTGNGSFLINIPDFIGEGPFDLIADCAGNFYVLNVTRVNAPPYLRKYSHTGALLNSWSINNPNNYFLGNGSGMTAGFGIIGNNIYVDNINASGTKTIISGTINTTTVDFTNPSAPATIPFSADAYAGDFGSCASSIPVSPQITITASATTVISGTLVTFNSTINAGGPHPQYQWYVNGAVVSGATNSTYTYAPAPNDVVTCQLASDLPCIATPTAISNAITIEIEGCPPIKLDYINTVYCQSNGTAIPVFSPSGGTFTVNPASLNVNSNTGTIDLSTADLGTYIITYSVPAIPECPAQSIKDTIKIAESPSVYINVKDKISCINQQVVLSATEEPGYSYKWSPSEYFPSGDNTASVTARIVESGTIYVIMTNGAGCSATDSLTLDPKTCCNVMVPSAFSPNNDGNNDIFKINAGTTQKINQFSIYNRFGQRIFFTTNQDIGWDGTYKSGFADQGVYYYYLSYTCSNGELFIKKGDVTLIR